MAQFTIRQIARRDLTQVVEFVYDLAELEQEESRLTMKRLDDVLFGDWPLLCGHVAEVENDVVGCALWYLTFSAYEATPAIYLEDLYVRRSERGLGIGKALDGQTASGSAARAGRWVGGVVTGT